MWHDQEILKLLGTWCKWGAIILAFLAAFAAVFTLSRREVVRKYATWISVFLAVFSGITGIFAATTEQRIETLVEILKKTPPSVDARILTGEKNQFYVVFVSRNQVPFECQWFITTRESLAISPVPLEWLKIYPPKTNYTYVYHSNINANMVADNYVEFRFDYHSTHAAEVNDPKLSGAIYRKYQLVDGILNEIH
jgi:hypothetical protein